MSIANAFLPARSIAVSLFLLLSCAAAADDLQKAKWLSGCWAGTDGGRSFEERWMPPRGGAMVGVGRSFRGEKMSNTELTILRSREGGLSYEAFPVGQPPAVFPSIKVTEDTMVFEDLQHDFPQRIIYRRTAKGTLLARIEGKVDGKERGIEYPMKRVPCE